MIILTLDELLKKLRVETKHVYIWGVGAYGNLLGQLFDREKIVWDGYYDNFESDGKKCKHGKMIYGVENIRISDDVIYILSMRNYSAVKNQLIEIGVRDTQIWAFDSITVFDSIEDTVLGDVYDSEQMEYFHNRHIGEKCIIVGNGPSLVSEDLEAICRKGIYSFGANYIFKMYDKTAWRPNFYCITDPVGIEEIFAEDGRMEYLSSNCDYIFSRTNGKLGLDKEKANNIRLFKYVYSPSEEKYEFSNDCSKRVYIGYTITYVMMQLAVYMGFKQIYLIGIDHTQSVETIGGKIIRKNMKNYSEEMELGNKKGFYPIDKTTAAYMAAERYSRKQGVKIYNATRGGKLEVFERVDLDKILK